MAKTLTTHEPVGAIADDLRERALRDGLSKLECAACPQSAWVSDVDQIVELVTHVLDEHGHTQSIVGIKITQFADGYVLADRRGPTSPAREKIGA